MAATESKQNVSARNPDANRLGLDYRAEAAKLGTPVVPIIDAHIHVNGGHAARVFKDVAVLYGIDRIVTQTRLAEAHAVRDVLGPMARFVAVPDYGSADRRTAMTSGYLADIERWRTEFDARLMKLWCAPRLRDLATGDDANEYVPLDSPWRIRQVELAQSLGMMVKVHIADPDTWFSTKYADASRYGTKRSQYEPLERMLDRFAGPWILAHMGGWPEDLAFLSDLLDRHPALNLDTSATKWMVRELSKHSRDEVVDFLSRYAGRILFGSDIVTTDEHLMPEKKAGVYSGELASSPEQAFELYASRYWALRTLWETEYNGPSPIADPDLAMVDPSRFAPTDAPLLRGKSLDASMLRTLYAGAARRVFGSWLD
ncbi:MAG: amidohydrolase family protein [Phycisphaeraceae bacterium]|nr:amidohydrolase family protein [Phycisphaeraceae bacterium]MBX3365987.1 amidohydrolase family protein [Phycisphaeraceae bacterium]